MSAVNEFRVNTGDEWEQFVAGNIYALSLERVLPSFAAHARRAALPQGVNLAEIEVGGYQLHRSRQLIRSNPSDDLLLVMQLSGFLKAVSPNQAAMITAGQAMFFDPREDYTISTGGGAHLNITVPRAFALSSRSDTENIRMRPLEQKLAPLRVLRLLVEEMISDPGGSSLLEREGISVAATDLMRAAATMSFSNGQDATGLMEDCAIIEAIKDYLIEHLEDAQLHMEDVSGQFTISLRRLNKLFVAEEGPATFLRHERLRRARENLSNPMFAELTLKEIGAHSGYPDPSIFTRAFKREFGILPKDARHGGLPNL
jgi:AraC-like DNA-binding protein